MKFKSDIEIQAGVEAGGSTGSNGQVLSSTGSGVAWINQGDITIGEAETAKSLQVTVKNVSGGELTKGTVVHTAPTASPPSGNVIEVIAADYDDTAKMPAVGILKETIANEAEGEAVMTGALSGIATDGFSIGDELYVGADGALTNIKPQTAGQLIQKIAVCVKSHASNGLIKIFGAGRSNDVPLPLYIDNANQRLGIGTASPDFTLDVSGDIGLDGKIYHNGDHNTYIGFTGDTQTFRTGGSDRVTINNTGVGIGTNSPTRKLSVVDGDIDIKGGANSRLFLNIDTNYLYGDTNGVVMLLANDNVRFRTQNIERMRIDSNGNVGIGVVPADRNVLDIRSDDTNGVFVTHRNNDGFFLNRTYADYNNDGNTVEYQERIGVDGNRSSIGNHSNHTLGIRTNNQDRITVLAGGNVGIGTTTPSEKLNVSGNILATGTILGSNLSGTNTGDQDLSGYLRSDANDQTGPGIKTWFGGALNSGSGATIQVNGFQRTGNIYLHSGGNSPDNTRDSDYLSNINGDLHWNKHDVGNGKVWTSVNDGSDSGLDADTLDGQHASAFLTSYSETDTLDSVADRGRTTNQQLISTNTSGFRVDSGSWARIEIDSNNNWSYVRLQDNGATTWDIASYNGGVLELRPGGSGANRTYFDASGNSFSEGSKRAPIFYDSNNTGYYLNPAGTSLLNRLEVDDDIDMRAQTGTWITSNVMSDAIGWNTSYGVYIGSNVGGTHYLRGNGTFTTGGGTYNLWHAGNDGSGSGLDADLLDGQHASAFANSSHNHDSDYVNVSGDTMTGTLTIDTGGNSTNALVLKGTSPTMSFLDDSGEDDFYIHVNSNNFYVLVNRDANDLVGTGYESPHPLQLEGDTNRGYLFGSRMFAENYHPNADKWTTARTITLGGDLTGNVSIDGSANVTLNAQVADDSHSHSNYLNRNSSIESNLDTKYDADLFGWNSTTTGRPENYGQGISIVSSGNTHNDSSNWISQLGFGTAGNTAYFRTKVNSGAWSSWHKLWHSNNDGSGSGLDADTVDGLQASQFLRSDANDTTTGVLTILNSGDPKLILQTSAGDSSDWNYINFVGRDTVRDAYIGTDADGDLNLYSDKNSIGISITATGTFLGSDRILTTADEGSGNGLDADTLDGQHASDFQAAGNYQPAGSYVTTNTTQTVSAAKTFSSANNRYSGHLFYDPWDANGNHYPHFTDGSNANGVNVNWRLYSGSSLITHTWNYTDTNFVNSLRSTVDLRAPSFYDSDNTGYYLNPASSSKSAHLRGHVEIINEVPKLELNDFTATNTTNQLGYISYQQNGTETGWIGFGSGSNSYLSVTNNSGIVSINGTYTLHNASSRAPIFYDSNDTNYFINPNSQSKISSIWAVGVAANTAPRWDTSFHVVQSQHWYGHSGSQTMYLGESSNPVRLRGSLRVGSDANADSGMVFTANGNANATSSLRAPIFYDSNNTVFYVDPASTSQLNYIDAYRFRDFSDTGYYLEPHSISYLNDIRPNIMYDRNDTNYYVNPASNSKLYDLQLRGNYVRTYRHSGSDFTSGTLVQTDIPSSSTNGASFVLEATGKSYSSDTPFSFIVQGYLYNNTIINHSGVHMGKPGFTTMKAMDNGGTLAFWWPRVSYWNSFTVHVRDAGGDDRNRVTNIINSTEPSSSKKVTINMKVSTVYGQNINAGDLYASRYYDSNDTAYYLDPASTSNLANLVVGGNTTLGNGNGDTTKINDILELYATDSGDSHFYFGENSSGGYGTYWNWDSGYRHTWYSRHAGTNTSIMYHDTNDTGYLHMARSIHLHNRDLNYVNQLHFNDNVRFYDAGNDSYLNFKYGDASTGGIKFLNGGGSLKGYVYANADGFGLLDNDGSWAVKTQTGTSPLILHCDNNPEFYVYTSYTYSPGSSRAPIFYDSDNTGYYLNPASTSVLNGLNVSSTISGTTNGNVKQLNTSSGNIDDDWGTSFKTFDPIPTGTPPIQSPNIRTINVGENFGRRTQLAFDYASDRAWFRRRHNTTWHTWREFWHDGNFNPSSYLTTTGKAADSDLLDGIDSGSFLRSDANDSFSGILTGTGGSENLIIGGIRGTAKGVQTGQYIHLYERVHIGGPQGWGASTHNAPATGLSTWGDIDVGLNGTGVLRMNGSTVITASRGGNFDRVDSDIYYDANDTGYYIDPGNTGTSAKFAGNVGIGTTSPGYKLDVAGSSRFQNSVYIDTNTGSDALFVTRLGGASESLKIYTTDSASVFETIQDETTTSFGSMMFKLDSGAPDPDFSFWYGEARRLKIEGGTGNVGIGTGSPGQKLDVAGNIECNSLYLNNDSSLYFLPTYFGQRIKANCGGLLVQNGSTYQAVYASAFSVQSDYRLKSNVVPLDNAIDRLKQMSVHRFNWNDRLDEPKVDGFIAHELSEVIPEAVLGEKDATKEDGTPDYQGIDQSKIVPLLTAALQDAITKIEQLETRIQTLENNN